MQNADKYTHTHAHNGHGFDSGPLVKGRRFPPNATWFEWARDNGCLLTEEGEAESRNEMEIKGKLDQKGGEVVAAHTNTADSEDDRLMHFLPNAAWFEWDRDNGRLPIKKVLEEFRMVTATLEANALPDTSTPPILTTRRRSLDDGALCSPFLLVKNPCLRFLAVVGLVANWVAWMSRMESYAALGMSRFHPGLISILVAACVLQPLSLGCGQAPLIDLWPMWLLHRLLNLPPTPSLLCILFSGHDEIYIRAFWNLTSRSSQLVRTAVYFAVLQN
ncbi:hypothetical protein TSMEX_007149 [Taenia solium]|eukprot:TsM_000342500 transcript=TsM_000342500 gene=TsM_000342500